MTHAAEHIVRELAKQAKPTPAMVKMLGEMVNTPNQRAVRQYHNPATCDALVRRKLIKKIRMPKEYSSIWYELTPLGFRVWAAATGNHIQ